MDSLEYEQIKKLWKEALLLPGYNDLVDSGVKELSDFLKKDIMEIKNILFQSEVLFAEEWKMKGIKVDDENSVERFYNETQLELFELMDWHVNKIENGPLVYVCALDLAKKFKCKNYLDYGSGIGSGAILFAKNNFQVSVADVSSPLLSFLKYRFQKRNLEVDLIDLKNKKLKNEMYDIVTCFDVLEHSLHSHKIVCQIRAALKTNGFFVTNNLSIKKDSSRPMHISEVNLEYRIRYLGFEQLWNLQKDLSRTIGRDIVVLRKVNRPFFINFIYFIYDNLQFFILNETKESNASK